MVVVQHRTQTGLVRLFVGSTANGAAAHCHCPLVSVPSGWQPGETSGEVVVGVHEGGVPRQVLEEAFAWADATGCPLRVVHAWRLDAAYDDIITGRVADRYRDEQKQLLAGAVQELRASHPAVEVVLEVRHQWPAEVLVDDSLTASLVVVGRRGPHGWVREHLGSLTRTVLRAAKSPVMVVPVDPPQEVLAPPG
jgi:nucleotide-binding universal stress UspA family protein